MAKAQSKIAKTNVSPYAIDELLPSELAELSTTDLRSLQDQLAEQKATLSRRLATLQMACLRKFGEQAQARLRAADKDSGVVHVVDGKIDVECKTDKDVKWDQDLLRAASDQLAVLSPDLPKHYIDTKISVSETNYKAAPPQIQNILQPARTVTTRKMAFTFKDAKS